MLPSPNNHAFMFTFNPFQRWLIRFTPKTIPFFQVRNTRDDPEDPHPARGARDTERERVSARGDPSRERGERTRVPPAGETRERRSALVATHADQEPQRQQQLRDARVQEPRQHLTKVQVCWVEFFRVVLCGVSKGRVTQWVYNARLIMLY